MTVRGGMKLGLTLYNNSGGSAGTLWGRGWRSSFDVDVVESTPRTNPRRCTVVFGDGSAIPFVARSKDPEQGQVGIMETRYSPPVGQYDVLTRFGDGRGGWTMRRPDQSNLWFDGQGRLTKIVDRRGNTITINRASGAFSDGHITSVSDPAGRQLTFEYGDTPSSIYSSYRSVTDPTGRKWTFDISAPYLPGGTRGNRVGDLLSITLPPVNGSTDKIQWGYSYAEALIMSERDPMNNVWQYTYASTAGELKTAKDPLLKTTTYACGANATMTTPMGAVWTHVYQGDSIAQDKDPAGYVESYHYDAYRNRDQITDRNGKITRMTFDAFGNQISSQDPVQYSLGKSETYSYNDRNDLIRQVNARNGATVYTVPWEGNTTSVVDEDGINVLSGTYDLNGQPTSVTNAGVDETITYDDRGRLVTSAGADGIVTVQYGTPYGGKAMGAVGLPSVVIDRLGVGRYTTYDTRGRLTGVNIGGTGETTLEIDALGRVTKSYEASGNTTLTYDANSRVKTLTNGRGNVETYTYDDDGNLTRIDRGNGAWVQYSVKPRGDVWMETTSEGYVSYASYDGEGNVVRSDDGVGLVTYTYLDDGSLWKVTHPDGFVETYAYDADGNRTSMTDRSGTTTWTYSLADRVQTMTSGAGTVTYTYDAKGNPWKIAHSGPGGPSGTITTNYSYPSGRVTSYGDATTNEIVSYTYNSVGQLTGCSYPGGATTQYTYDAWDRPLSIVNKRANGSTFQSEQYTYSMDQVASKTVDGVTTNYAYDTAGQLASEVRPGYDASYTYDGNGNRLTRTINGNLDTYSYTGDRLNSIARSFGGTVSGTKSYTYDGAGRPTSITGFDGTNRPLTWDDEDRLLASPATPTSVYNGDGARVKRAGVWQRRAASEIGSEILNDGIARHLVPGLSERQEPYATRFRVDDRMGNTVAHTDASGSSMLSTLQTDAFGVPWSQTYASGQTTRSGFASAAGYEDEGAGVHLVGERWYDADAGRFLTRDPARDGSNWWIYCENDPINLLDAMGTDPRRVGQIARKKSLDGTAKGPGYDEYVSRNNETETDSKGRRRNKNTDCGLFVGECVRGGDDKEFPSRGTSKQAEYLKKSPKYEEAKGPDKPGDIAIHPQRKGENFGHVMVMGSDGSWYEASYGNHPPRRTNRKPDSRFKRYRRKPEAKKPVKKPTKPPTKKPSTKPAAEKARPGGKAG